MPSGKSTYREVSGFTLIEIMITLVIVGIIAGIALPSYSNYVIDARRTDGQVALRAAAQALERCRTETFTYDNCTFSPNSDDGYYELNVTNLSSTTYTLTATPTVGKSQDGDSACAAIVLIQDGTGTPGECW